MKKINLILLGCGQRGAGMGKLMAEFPEIKLVAVCDVYPDKAENLAKAVQEIAGYTPKVFTDWTEAIKAKADAVMISTSWESHIPIAIETMKKGLITLMEVGGAYSVEDCFDLVRTYEETKTPIMMLENACFNRTELLATALVRNGLFGEIVHCEGAYGHDCRNEIANGESRRHYRLRNYLTRNCDTYPTHNLGPIAKILNINRGNRMVSLVSVASKAKGMEDYIASRDNIDESVKGKRFKHGDIVTTIITCANGETITLRLDTTLPRYYSRNFTVRGTKGMYEQDPNLVFLDRQAGFGDDTVKLLTTYMDNGKEYEEKYLCDEWKNITEDEKASSHSGIDLIMLREIFRIIQNGEELPIDVYDTASWMVITALSEQSVAAGGAVQMIPDFTHGEWITREPKDVMKLPVY